MFFMCTLTTICILLFILCHDIYVFRNRVDKENWSTRLFFLCMYLKDKIGVIILLKQFEKILLLFIYCKACVDILLHVLCYVNNIKLIQRNSQENKLCCFHFKK